MTKYHCDRCNDEMTAHQAGLKVIAGSFGPFELCVECLRWVQEWLQMKIQR
jgi:hypothetical protein